MVVSEEGLMVGLYPELDELDLGDIFYVVDTDDPTDHESGSSKFAYLSSIVDLVARTLDYETPEGAASKVDEALDEAKAYTDLQIGLLSVGAVVQTQQFTNQSTVVINHNFGRQAWFKVILSGFDDVIGVSNVNTSSDLTLNFGENVSGIVLFM